MVFYLLTSFILLLLFLLLLLLLWLLVSELSLVLHLYCGAQVDALNIISILNSCVLKLLLYNTSILLFHVIATYPCTKYILSILGVMVIIVIVGEGEHSNRCANEILWPITPAGVCCYLIVAFLNKLFSCHRVLFYVLLKTVERSFIFFNLMKLLLALFFFSYYVLSLFDVFSPSVCM